MLSLPHIDHAAMSTDIKCYVSTSAASNSTEKAPQTTNALISADMIVKVQRSLLSTVDKGTQDHPMSQSGKHSCMLYLV